MVRLKPTKLSQDFKEHFTPSTSVTLATDLEETHLLFKTMELFVFLIKEEWVTPVSIFKNIIVPLQEEDHNRRIKMLLLSIIKAMVAEETPTFSKTTVA